MGEEQKSKEESGTQQEIKQQEAEKKEEQKIDVEKVKSETMSSFLKELGIEDKDSLKNIVTKAKEEEEKNKTELQKKNDTLEQMTKELANEREARIMAEAKLSAIQLGAKKELVEDLVIVAKSKVTNDKDIKSVIAEIKDSDSGKVYFESEEEKEKEKGTVTRGRVTKPSETKKKKEEEKENNDDANERHAGTMAERLLSKRKQTKKHYFN